MKSSKLTACLLAAAFTGALHADNARFDLDGPKIEVRVTRASTTLPIAEVPNLQSGDKLWVKADLPPSQSNHLLLVVAFLRGTTNEPPDSWFTEIETWDKKQVEGATIVVPDGAQQALLFVAPETGGDFKTLRSAVKGKPGVFIRADADLNEASFEQQRIERYLAAMKSVPPDDSKAIQDHSSKLAATLALKPNADCFKQPVDQQVNCLTQSSAPVLLDDGHGQTIAEAVSTGPSSDFINQASYTQPAGGGVYSAYVGAVVDLVHLVSSLHTPQFQYIPGISFPQGDTLHLKLNAPPSFNKPKSVIVIGLPAIQKANLPPLRPHDPDQVACLLQPKFTLLLQGAPLVFSTSFAHDIVLHVNRTAGEPLEVPLKPDAFEGGLVAVKDEPRKALQDDKQPGSSAAPADTDVKPANSSDVTVTGTVRGYWGFDRFEGPTLTLQQVDGKDWKISGDTQLLAGQENHLVLDGNGTACVQHIELSSSKNQNVEVPFKPAARDSDKATDASDKAGGGTTPKAAGGSAKAAQAALDLEVSLKKVQPGGYALAIQQYGEANVDKVSLTAYTGDIHLDSIQLHAGDSAAILTGQGLRDVVSVEMAKQTFTPVSGGGDNTSLHLQAKTEVSPSDGSDATVKLRDGRTMTVKVAVQAPRPGLKLISLQAIPARQVGAIPITLGAKNDIALNGKLTFVVQTEKVFPRTQTIEVATADGSVHTTLSLAGNNLILQDEHTAIATLEPLKAFGQSAFGRLQMRPVAQDGTTGDWTALGVLVRTPQIAAIHCTTAAAPACTADGNNFFLVQSFDASRDFTKPTDVPTGFADSSFTVPTPADGSTLYLKLRDDPGAVASVTLPTPVEKATRVPAAPAEPAMTGAATASSTAATDNIPGTAASAAAADPGPAGGNNASSAGTKPVATPSAATPAPGTNPSAAAGAPAATPAPAAAADPAAPPANTPSPASPGTPEPQSVPPSSGSTPPLSH